MRLGAIDFDADTGREDGMTQAFNCDCMEYMKTVPDKYFDLAVVDPPYGVRRFENGATSRLAKYGDFKSVNDWIPDKAYFDELRRVSKNQIVWGYNHLSHLLPCTSEFLFWWKHQCVPTYADGELAYTSFTRTAKIIDLPFRGSVGADKDARIHPTQKPVALYRWIYQQYAKDGDKILDTHLGSGSSRIAAYDMGLDFVGCEIDKEYFDKQEERFAAHIAQQSLFVDYSQEDIWTN